MTPQGSAPHLRDLSDGAGNGGSGGGGEGGGPAHPSVGEVGHLTEIGEIVLRVENLVVEYRSNGQRVQAVSDISFDILAGETLGLVGESGCGKSTTGRAVAQVQKPNSGTVVFEGRDLTALKPSELRKARTRVQMIFQDPVSSLNPRRRVIDIVCEPLSIWKIGSKQERLEKAKETLDSVGMDPESMGDRRPVEFSGGQCQRVSIARALMLEPRLLICDEPVSSLDVSVQAQILNLLQDLKDRYGLTMLFIAHDLAVVKNVSDRVAVMYLGKLCELAPADVLYERPAHPYSEALLASIPEPVPGSSNGHAPLKGDLPSPIDPPSGCRFRTRCAYAEQRCADEEPQMREIRPGQLVACHFPLAEVPQSNGSSVAQPVMPPPPPEAATP